MMIALPLLLIGCGKGDDTNPKDNDGDADATSWSCTLQSGSDPDYANQIGCIDDFELLASAPLDASIPGAQSVKTVFDRVGEEALYFQNSKRYLIHWEFASAHLSGVDGLPIVGDLGTFNINEYYSPDRRFILGAITWYEGPQVWAYEIAPYDTADAGMVETAYNAIRDNAYFGDDLYFHPSSLNVEQVVGSLSADVKVIGTDELFEGIDYQPLNLGSTVGWLTFRTAEEVDGTYTPAEELVVLDRVPNDISIVRGIVTGAFQTPLSHINVLSQNRGSPNMALKQAWYNEELRALEGSWVELTVDAFDWSVRAVTAEDAAAWWEANKPEPLETVPMDLSVTEITDAERIIDPDLDLDDELSKAIPAFGGKASHFGALKHIGESVPVPDGLAIPVFFYNQFMETHGFWAEVDAMLSDEAFNTDPQVRADRLAALQGEIRAAPLDLAFMEALYDELEIRFAGIRMRFRSSTTAEDLGDFTGAGLYTSAAGTPGDPNESVEDAIRTVFSSVWNIRAYDERQYYSIDHRQVGMAVLSHPSFPDEEANGVAITANIFDATGLEPAFYVNVQQGGESVVLPDAGVISDQFLYYFTLPGQPIVYIAHSNLIPEGESVLTVGQVYELGVALDAIQKHFFPVYGGSGFYGMDTEFKFDDDGNPNGPLKLYLKQARPYPGWGG